MEERTKILNIPINNEIGFTPITQTRFTDIPFGLTGGRATRHFAHKSLSLRHAPRSVYDTETDEFYFFELTTRFNLHSGESLVIRESSDGGSLLDWEISLYRNNVRLLHVAPNYAQVLVMGEKPVWLYFKGGSTFQTVLDECVYFERSDPLQASDFFVGSKPGYDLKLVNMAECAPAYFSKGRLRADNQEEAIEYIDTLMINLAKAKQAIQNTVVMTDYEIQEYCDQYKDLVNQEDVLFKGF